jgi:hypothetical protein
MKTIRLRITVAVMCSLAVCCVSAQPKRDSVVTAIFSRSASKYERRTRPDGSPAMQTYVISNGGADSIEGKDPSIEKIGFSGIVRVLGPALAKRAYYPAKNAAKADLLLVLHWGKTRPNPQSYRSLFDMAVSGQNGKNGDGSGNDSLLQFAQQMRYAADEHNADLLGYTAELKYRNNISLVAGAGSLYEDLINDIESERYYIIVTAIDFQDMMKNQKKNTLWRTVVSIDARSNRFGEQLNAMIDRASRYFGKDSGRLLRQFEYTSHVELGELKVLGEVDKKPELKK